MAAAALLLLPALAPVASAQQSALEREVKFVRDLATRLRFIELAQEHTARLQKAYTDSDDFKRVSQLDIEISLIGARAHPDREERRALFQQGLEKSTEFIDRYSSDPVADDARVTMVQACVAFGEFLNDEIEVARTEAPDKVAELEERAADMYRNGIAVCDEFLKNNRARATAANPELQQKYYFCWLNKAILQRENARAVKRDRVPLAELSRETFEELILDIGEESLLGLRGYFEMSRIGEILGDYETAVQDYRDTIESISISLDSEELELSAWLEGQLIDLMQEAYAALMKVQLEDGQPEEAIQTGQEFRTNLRRFAGAEEDADIFEVASDFGHAALLTEARALAESGEKDKVGAALAQIQKINDLHEEDILGIRAKSVLSQVLELNAGDSSIVTGATLFEVAKGEYQSRNYEPAIQGFKRAYAAMTDAEQGELGLELWNTVGRCFASQKRWAEACLAFAKGLEAHGGSGGDGVSPVADSLDRAWSQYRRTANGDEGTAMSGLDTRFGGLIARFADKENASKRFWKDGTESLVDGKYDKARTAYKEVTPDSPYYEPAQARIALTLQLQNEFAKARKVIADYRAWTASEEARIPPNDRTGAQGRRDQALAAIAYYELAMDFDEANPSEGQKDATKFPDLVSRISNYFDEHSSAGQSYFEKLYNMQAELQAELGQLDRAEATYRKLNGEFPGSPYVASLATRIFLANQEKVKALQTEYDSQVKAGAAANELQETFSRLQAARRAALSIAMDYASTSTSPSYAMLSNAVDLAHDLKDWPTVEKVGRQIRELYGEGELGKKVANSIVPAIGEALLRQKKFREAETTLREAIEADPKDYASKRLLALTLGGWIELDERFAQVSELGLGKPVEGYHLMFEEYRKYVKAKYPDYTLEWYQFMWETYLLAKRAAEKDSKYQSYAATLYRKADGQENFKTLNTLGLEGERLFQLFTSNRP